jgi:hypothetical protein
MDVHTIDRINDQRRPYPLAKEMRRMEDGTSVEISFEDVDPQEEESSPHTFYTTTIQ